MVFNLQITKIDVIDNKLSIPKKKNLIYSIYTIFTISVIVVQILNIYLTHFLSTHSSEFSLLVLNIGSN
jgi:hypothetical protein